MICKAWRQRWAAMQLAALLGALLALQPLLCAAQANTTLPADVDALVGFMSGITAVGGTVLAGWDVYADPCMGSWPGVICSCEDLPRMAELGCNSTMSPPDRLRVRGLDLGPVTTSSSKKLSGTIHPSIGNLKGLVYLDLSDNELSGMLPESLANLDQLQYLLLENNQLTGALPSYLAPTQMPQLRRAMLQNNKFAGPVPLTWCSSNATYDIEDNEGLCGVLPKCFTGTSRVPTITGTYLSNTTMSPGSETGGACDVTPPDCDADVGCVIWTPRFWTSLSIVAFNFTGFMDYESSIMRYKWGIGSSPFTADVVPLQSVTGDRLLKDIKYSGGTKKMFVTPVVHNLTSLSLLEGPPYYVTVVAYNGAGPPLSTNTSSAAVYVDTSGPVPAAVYNTYSFQQASTTKLVQTLQASWDNFTDPQSGLVSYSVQFFSQVRDSKNGSVDVTELTEELPLGLATRVQMRVSQLPHDMMYFAKVTATNGAGLTTTVSGLPITVDKSMDGAVAAGKTALIAVMCGLGCLAIGAVMAILIMKGNVHQKQQKEKERQQEAKQLKALMYSLVNNQSDTNADIHDQSKRHDGSQEMAFVVTDIESSTELSNQDPEAFKQLQELHDQIMREGIAKHHGYEIITEGDSFQVAFGSVQKAVAFCMEAQYRLVESTWSKEVLKLDACKVVKDSDGNVIFCGPRVRMGVHVAKQGTVAVKLHHLTRHKVFAGPAMTITQEVSETANGGQIVLTEDAVSKLTENMASAGFPVVRLVGQFQLPSLPAPTFLFSITEAVGKTLRRHSHFRGLRKIEMTWPPKPTDKLPANVEYNINMPPLPENHSKTLSFAVLRLTEKEKGPRDRNGIPEDKANKRMPVCDLPPFMVEKFNDVFAVQVQQFKGYLFHAFQNSFQKGVWAAAFQSSMDAMRFTHAAQMLLMHMRWPQSAQQWCGEAVPGNDGRWTFNGPRVCMAIHQTNEYFVSEDDSMPSNPRKGLNFAGPGFELTLALTYAGRGGQVILTEPAWDAVKVILMKQPGAHSVISLGKHVLSDQYPKEMLLMEVMPALLSKRVFYHVQTQRQTEPGYRDAPDPKDPMTIVFAKVEKPKDVKDAEKGKKDEEELGDDDIAAAVNAYQIAVQQYAATLRKLLTLYGGYECKEPEPGKFTLVFAHLEAAIRWACHLQEELVYIPWHETLLQMNECKPVFDDEGNLLWRGLRVKIGMSHGMVSSKKPLNTGRADYFGVLPNGAARVMSIAAPGQVLVEAQYPPTINHELYPPNGEPLLQAGKVTYAKMKYVPGVGNRAEKVPGAMEQSEESVLDDPKTIQIQAIGLFELRGLDLPRLLFQANGVRLSKRDLSPMQMQWAPPSAALAGGGGGINASFASSAESLRRKAEKWHSWLEKKTNMLGRRSVSPSHTISNNSTANSSPIAVKQRAASYAPGTCRGRSNLSGNAPAGGLFAAATDGLAADGGSVKFSRQSPGNSDIGHSPSYMLNSHLQQGLLPRTGSLGTAERPESAPGWSGPEGGPESIRSRSWIGQGQKVVAGILDQQQEVQGSEFQEIGELAGRSTHSELLVGQQQQLHEASNSSLPLAAGLQQLQSRGQRHSSAPHLQGLGDHASDPVLSRLQHLPNIKTAPAPGGLDSDSPSSITGSPSPMSPYTEGSNGSPLTPAAAVMYGQQLQHSRLGTAGMILPTAGNAAQQYSHKSGGGCVSVNASVDTTMSNLDFTQMMAEQQQIQQYNMMYSSREGGPSCSSSIDKGMKGFMAGVSGGPQEPKQPWWTVQALYQMIRPGRYSQNSSGGARPAATGAAEYNEEVDGEATAVRFQLGSVPGNGSLPQTPASTCSAGSWGQGGVRISHALPSPGTAFAADVAQTFVNQRHNSVTSQHALLGPYGQRMPSSSSYYHGYGSVSPQPGGSPVHAGPPGGSRNSSYSYAPSSYSPHHFQHGTVGSFSLGCGWQQQQQQQQQQHQYNSILAQQAASAAAGKCFAQEPSLNYDGAYAASLAAATAVGPEEAVNHASIEMELSLAGGTAMPDAFEDMVAESRTEATARMLNMGMHASYDAQQASQQQQVQWELAAQQRQLQEQIHNDQQQQLWFSMQRQPAFSSAMGTAAPGEAVALAGVVSSSASAETSARSGVPAGAGLEQIDLDAAALARTAAAAGVPFTLQSIKSNSVLMSEEERIAAQAAIGSGMEVQKDKQHVSFDSGLDIRNSLSSLQQHSSEWQEQQQQLWEKQQQRLQQRNSDRQNRIAAMHQMMQQRRDRGVAVYSTDEYAQLLEVQRKEVEMRSVSGLLVGLQARKNNKLQASALAAEAEEATPAGAAATTDGDGGFVGVVSEPVLQPSNSSSAAASPRNQDPREGSPTHMQAQQQMNQHQQVLLQELRQLQQPECRQAMGKPSPLGNLTRSRSGNMPGSPSLASSVDLAANKAELQHAALPAAAGDGHVGLPATAGLGASAAGAEASRAGSANSSPHSARNSPRSPAGTPHSAGRSAGWDPGPLMQLPLAAAAAVAAGTSGGPSAGDAGGYGIPDFTAAGRSRLSPQGSPRHAESSSTAGNAGLAPPLLHPGSFYGGTIGGVEPIPEGPEHDDRASDATE